MMYLCCGNACVSFRSYKKITKKIIKKTFSVYVACAYFVTITLSFIDEHIRIVYIIIFS